MIEEREKSSFRDPSGFVFYRDGVLLRQVNPSYQSTYELLESSGLYGELVEKGLLVKTEPIARNESSSDGATFLRPERIPLISYPFEWSFSQLKDAALATLTIQEASLSKGMTLKDASAYNVQFRDGKPIFIDSLSFDPYVEGEPWIAYRQFCRHFLAPLALMSYVDIRLGGLGALHLDGIPLDLVAKLLPSITKLKPGLLSHIHIHAKGESHFAGAPSKVTTVSKTSLLALVDSLHGTISGLKWSPGGTEWGNYYEETNYSSEAMEEKHALVRRAIERVGKAGDSCWDLGANNGEFSRLASEQGLETVAWDIDPAAVEKNYLKIKANGEKRLLPLLQDLTNPSTDFGWANEERSSLVHRGPADVVLALALIHHLAIGNNVPLAMISEFLAKVGNSVVVEFVPKQDSQVQRMLSHRKDIFDAYDVDTWRKTVASKFEILEEWSIPRTSRTLFVLRKRG
jgi:ribosomal protein L11 methylase PrmA